MVRLVTDDDIGLRVLRDAPADAAEPIDIVAVHGLGAHPDDSWCKNVGTKDSPKWVNWLMEENMLPAVAPQARIMRYGYQSQWFGEGAMRQKASTVAQRLLAALGMEREEHPFRPLLFVAHCFGGLVVLKALVEARHHESEWPGIFASTTGLIFFGTPFRGADGMSQVEMLAAAQREYVQDEIQADTLAILQPGNEFLQEVVDQFGKTRKLVNKAQVACFYELKSSNVGRIVGGTDRTRFVVSESSGCLDLADATSKWPLSRTHFDMNKFGRPTEEDFRIVSKVVKDMIKASPGLLLARSQCNVEYNVDFSLRDVPVGKFAERPRDAQALERALLQRDNVKKRRLLAAYGLGGVGKTQLAVNFARRHQHRFSSVFWLNGSGESSVKQSFAAFASRIPAGQIPDASRLYAAGQIGNIDAVVRDVLSWLSIAENNGWLMVVDNVDRDDRQGEEDREAYNVEEYLPEADHGSVLITTRLLHLGQLAEKWEVRKVDKEQAQAIFQTWYGRAVGPEGDELLALLDGLPLALAQAAAYMSETGTSFSVYTRLYKEQWQKLMEQDDRRMPLRSYANGCMATTWTISYKAVQAKNKAAANLLLLWAHLDNKGLWYGLLAAASLESVVAAERTAAWLGEMARSELDFIEAIRTLRSYSLVEAAGEQTGYSTHPVVHQWALYMQDDGQRAALSWLAVVLVGLATPRRKEEKYWETRTRLLPHAERCGKRIVIEGVTGQRAEYGASEQREDRNALLVAVNNLGSLYFVQGKLDKAEEIYIQALEGYKKLGEEHTLNTAHNLGLLYMIQGKLAKAEEMFMQALEGFKKLGDGHTLDTLTHLGLLYFNQGKLAKAEEMFMQALEGYSKLGEEHTLDTVRYLGILYIDQGKLAKAEEMYTQALQGYKKAVGPENIHTYVPALKSMLGIGLVSDMLGRANEARAWYLEALQGYEKVYGKSHAKCQVLRDRIAALEREEEQSDVSSEIIAQEQAHGKSIEGPGHQQPRAVSRRQKVLQKLGWKLGWKRA